MNKYCLLTSEGQIVDTNFTIIIINAEKAGNLNDLVVLKKDSEFHQKLNLEEDTIIIVDRYKKYLSNKMELLKVTEDIIKEDYLSYLRKN